MPGVPDLGCYITYDMGRSDLAVLKSRVPATNHQ
jgi:hypothetical protein